MSGVRMSASKMLLQILTSRESLTCAPDTIGVRTIEWSSRWTNTLLVNLSHMSQKTTTISKAWILFTGWFITLVRSLMLVHVFVPLARASECLSLALARFVVTNDFAILVARRLSLWAC